MQRSKSFRILLVTLSLCAAVAAALPILAQEGASIQINNSPLITYPGQQLPIELQIGNLSSSVVDDVGIQCFVSLDSSISTIHSGPFTYAQALTPSYIEFGADLTTNLYHDNVDIAPGQVYNVGFDLVVTASSGSTGLIECFLLQFHPAAGGFFLLAQTSTSVQVLALPFNKNDCMAGAWREKVRQDTSTFRNQGQCIQYVNTGK